MPDRTDEVLKAIEDLGKSQSKGIKGLNTKVSSLDKGVAVLRSQVDTINKNHDECRMERLDVESELRTKLNNASHNCTVAGVENAWTKGTLKWVLRGTITGSAAALGYLTQFVF